MAFDRFLTRLLKYQPDEWVLKGGYALQLRLGERTRTTKDIDVLALTSQEDILSTLRSAGSIDLGDWFLIEVEEQAENLPGDFGGMRFRLTALLDGRTFETFHIDIGVGDPLTEPVDHLQTSALLSFAGIQPTLIPCYPVNQQIAEKVHAYTRPRPSGRSSRIKDYVDILLMAQMVEIDGGKLYRALEATFDARGSHALPKNIADPPESWETPYRRLDGEVGLEFASLSEARDAFRQFLYPVLQGEAVIKWNPAKWLWEDSL